jgi:protein-tyrosine phosphatase
MSRANLSAAVLLAAGGCFACLVAVADEPKKVNPGQSLGIASVPNLRDIGGYKTRDGFVVRSRLLYRSNQLSRIRPADMDKIAGLGLKCDYDLRTADQRRAAPDELPPGVKNISLNVLADSKLTGPARVSRLLQNPKAANAELGDGKAEAILAQTYREFVTLPSANKAFHQFFVELGNAENLPALVHCSSGKDRTGWAVAALLSLLGVPDEAVMEDYLRSNDYVLPGYQRTIDSFTKAGGDPAIIKAVLGVKAEYLKASFDEVQTKYGTIEGYFSKGLGIDAAGQKALRDRFLVRDNSKGQ